MSTITGVAGVYSYTGNYLKDASDVKYQWDVEVSNGYTITEAKFAKPYSGITSHDDFDPEDWNNVNVGTPTNNVYSFQHAGNDFWKCYKFVISNGTDTQTYYIDMLYMGPKLVETFQLTDNNSADAVYQTDDTNIAYTEVEASGFTTLDSMFMKVSGWSSGDNAVNVTSVTVNGTAISIPDQSISWDGDNNIIVYYQWDSSDVAPPTLDAGDNVIVVTTTRGSETKTYTFNLNRA